MDVEDRRALSAESTAWFDTTPSFDIQLREHTEEADDEPFDSFGKSDFDVRTLLPESEWFALGTFVGGDLLFLATNVTGDEGTNPVVRYVHDEALVARVVAHSLGEFVALAAAEAFARRETIDFSRFKNRRLPPPPRSRRD